MNHPLDPPNDQALLRDVLADAARERDPLAERDAHLDADTLVAYHEGSLSDDDARRAKDHMVACETCAGLLTDLSAGFENDHADDADSHADALDLERATAWRALEAVLPAHHADTPRSIPLPSATAQSSALPSVLPWALAAILLATVAGLTWRLNQLTADATSLRNQLAVLDAPQAEVAIAYLDTLTRDAESEITVVVGPNRPFFLLILTPPLDEPERVYRIELLGPSGDTRWSSGSLVVNDHGTVRLALSRRFVPPGRYRVRLLDAGGTVIDGTVLDERALRVIDGP